MKGKLERAKNDLQINRRVREADLLAMLSHLNLSEPGMKG
jgi:hypothetical protein